MSQKTPILHESEYKLAAIVWEMEPIASGALAKEALKRLHWQRTTTYTVLRKLCDKGILENHNAVVTSSVKKEDVQQQETSNYSIIPCRNL
ncbi:MAG: BlaI/MecI/CopY family transcriptional regulator [Bacillota bacterium]|nr:BlaI/MecI/CopY family transcriptional regulator [Bacillota bacterium]